MGQPARDDEDLLRAAQAQYWLRVRRARVALRTFIEMCARNEEGQPIELSEIHLAWVWHVNYCWSRGKHAGILAPFGSGKSSTLAVPLAAFLIGLNPQIRIKFVSNADDYAKRRVGATKTILETEEYRDIFPHIKKGAKWGETELEVSRARGAIDATLHARGVLTKGVGLRADVEIFDDVCDQLNSAEGASRRKVKEFVRRTWLSRLDPRAGRALWIATPWDPDDATYDLMHDPKWCFLVQRVSKDLLHYDQEVFNAGDDYLAEMVGTPA